MMDELDAITLLYLIKNLNETGSLLDCAHAFQQTKAELKEALRNEESVRFNKALDDGYAL